MPPFKSESDLNGRYEGLDSGMIGVIPDLEEDDPSPPCRHGRACPAHPNTKGECLDARLKAGHDVRVNHNGTWYYFARHKNAAVVALANKLARACSAMALA